MLPIISEISFWGISVKKEIEKAKEEIKSVVSNQTIIHNNFNSSPADSSEIKEKREEEAREDEAQQAVATTKAKTVSAKASVITERQKKIQEVEKLVQQFLKDKFQENFRPSMKLSTTKEGPGLVLDGLIYENSQIKEIIEIKYISSENFEPFFFIASRFINKLIKLGIKLPVRFLIISEHMTKVKANMLNDQLVKIDYANRSLYYNISASKAQYFKINNNKLIEVKIDEN